MLRKQYNECAGHGLIQHHPRNAMPGFGGVNGDGLSGLQPLGTAGNAAHLVLGDAGQTTVSLFDQGLTQVLQAAATGLQPKSPYVLALSTQADGGGALQPLASFTTNPAGSAIVNAAGPIRQIVKADTADQRRYLVIVPERLIILANRCKCRSDRGRESRPGPGLPAILHILAGNRRLNLGSIVVQVGVPDLAVAVIGL